VWWQSEKQFLESNVAATQAAMRSYREELQRAQQEHGFTVSPSLQQLEEGRVTHCSSWKKVGSLIAAAGRR
jgi:hypothetical protein